MKKVFLPYRFACGYGMVNGLFLILTAAIPYFTKTLESVGQWPQYIYILFFVNLLLLSTYRFKRIHSTQFNVKMSLVIGVIIALVSAWTFALYNLFFDGFIDPDFASQQVAKTIKHLESDPNMTPDRLERLTAHAKRAHDPVYGSLTFLVVNLILGIVVSTVAGLIFKNKKR